MGNILHHKGVASEWMATGRGIYLTGVSMRDLKWGICLQQYNIQGDSSQYITDGGFDVRLIHRFGTNTNEDI